MAAKSGITYDAIMADLKARKFSPVYLLMGEESYYIDRISDYIMENALAPEARDFNQTVVFGADVNAAQVADMARRYPMMAEHQVIIVKEAQSLRGLDPIERYLENPVKSTILVICYKNGKIDARKRVVTMAQKVGVVYESKKLYDRELIPFVEKYAAEHQATIEPKAALMMAEHIGSDLNRLASELDKLMISFPEGERRITPELVEQKIGVSKDFNGFELRDAIVNRDVLKANRIIKYFDKNPKSGGLFAFMPLLFSYFQNLMVAYYTPNRNNDAAVATALGLKSPWHAKDYMTGMRNYTALKVMQIIGKMRETDAKSKGLDNPNTSTGDLMKELVFFILH